MVVKKWVRNLEWKQIFVLGSCCSFYGSQLQRFSALFQSGYSKLQLCTGMLTDVSRSQYELMHSVACWKAFCLAVTHRWPFCHRGKRLSNSDSKSENRGMLYCSCLLVLLQTCHHRDKRVGRLGLTVVCADDRTAFVSLSFCMGTKLSVVLRRNVDWGLLRTVCRGK
jgi:hypothetical protein